MPNRSYAQPVQLFPLYESHLGPQPEECWGFKSVETRELCSQNVRVKTPDQQCHEQAALTLWPLETLSCFRLSCPISVSHPLLLQTLHRDYQSSVATKQNPILSQKSLEALELAKLIGGATCSPCSTLSIRWASHSWGKSWASELEISKTWV